MQLMSSEYDPVTGITEEYWYWEDQGVPKITIRRLQDVDSTLDANKAEFNDRGSVNYADSNGMHKVARIPLMVLEKWLREEGFNWYKSTDKERRAQLNKPENRYLLTRPGRL